MATESPNSEIEAYAALIGESGIRVDVLVAAYDAACAADKRLQVCLLEGFMGDLEYLALRGRTLARALGVDAIHGVGGLDTRPFSGKV